MNYLVTECICQDPSHLMAFYHYQDDEPRFDELYISVQLNPRPWYRRLAIAARYVFGRRSQYGYGHWDVGCIGPESAEKLIDLLDRFLKRRIA